MKKGNKLIKTLLTTSALLLCTTCIAGAEYIESVDVNYTNSNKVEISGRDFDHVNGQYATIFVLRGDDLAADNFVPGTHDDKVERRTQVEIADGKFEYQFQLDMASMPSDKDYAVYTAYVKAGSFERVNSFVFTKDTKLSTLYNSLKSMDKDTFIETIYAESKRFVTSDSVYYQLNSDEGVGQKAAIGIAYAEWESEIKKISNVNEGVERLKDTLFKASLVEALNESKIQYVITDNEFNNPTILGLDSLKGTAYSLFSERDTTKLGINSDGKDKVIANIQGNSYKSLEDFQKGFVYEATLAAIHYNNLSIDGNTVIEILEDNNTYNGFLIGSYTPEEASDIAADIKDNKLWKFDDVQEALDIEETGGGGSSTGTPSSTSGSTGTIGIYSGNYSGKEPEQTSAFTDLESVEWAREAIERLAAAGVVAGRGNGIFAPNDMVTRAEFLTMLVKALGATAEDANAEFEDVIDGEWYYNTVAVGTTLGYASGYGNGLFGTNDLITRQDAAVMLNNAVTISGKTLAEVRESIDFADKTEVAEYAADDVEILVKAGILNGADGKFMPMNNCTRAEAAVMLSGLMTALGMEG